MTKQCSSCGGDCGNVCQRENVTQPEQEPDYLMAPSGRCHAPGGKKPLTAGHADNTYLKLWTRPPVQRQPLTEQQQVDCLVKAGCIGTVKMSFESGPYDITRPSINASRLIEAVEAAHGIEGATK